jgi:arylsulfatase A-like enzyme
VVLVWRSILALLLCSASAPLARAAEPPNVVFILLDDVGYGDLGAFGGSVETPNLDDLAREGVRFTHYRASAPVCSPSRAAILTGRHPLEFGLRNAILAGSQRRLPAGVETLAHHLARAGYATGHFGKWHLSDGQSGSSPLDYGFGRALVGGRRYFDPSLSVDGGPSVARVGHHTELITDEALTFIAENRDRRFFANVWYLAAHKPYQPPARWADRYEASEAGRRAATLSHADEQIGRILGALRALGLDSRTLVVVASDNGAPESESGANASFRGAKRAVFDGGVRVPLIARWLGALPPGTENASAVAGIDFVPTLLELAGLPVPAVLPGQSMARAWLFSEAPERRAPLFWEMKLPRAFYGAGIVEDQAWAVLRGDWKLVRDPSAGGGAPMLFDLARDPGETTDVASGHAELVEALTRDYRVWREAAARADTPIARIAGAASALGPWLAFDAGSVELGASRLVGVLDGDMTYAVRVVPARHGSEQIVAEHAGSWRLALAENGGVRLSISGANGTAVELESPAPVPLGVASDLAFTASSNGGTSRVRLFVDGVLQAEASLGDRVRASDAPLRLGNDASGARPFRGTLWGSRLHLVEFAPPELSDFDLDGALNAADLCIGVPDGPARPDAGGHVQRDSDADWIGDACDPDVNGDGRVGAADYAAVARAFGARVGEPAFRAALDFDGNGVVGSTDLFLVARSFGMPPGPSALVCTAASPCTAP